MRGFVSRLAPTRGQSVDAAIAAVLTAVALVGFRTSYGGVEFLVVGAVGIVVGVVFAHLVLAARPPVLVGVALAAVAYVVIGGVVALHERATAGFLPNADTVRSAAQAAWSGWKELITTNPPVGSTGTLMALPFLSGYGSALSMVVLARRFSAPQPCLVPAIVVVALTIVTGIDEPAALLVQGAMFGVVGIGWMSLREHRRRPLIGGQRVSRSRIATGAVGLAVAAAVGVVVAPRMPLADANERAVWRDTITPPFDPRVYPSPLSGYRKFLKDDNLNDSVLFTIEGLPDGTLVRLATLDAYDGLVWRPSYDAEQPSELNSGYFQRMGSRIESDFAGEVATLTVTIEAYSDVWVPDVGEVMSLRFEGGPRDRQLNESFRYNRATDTAASPVALARGDRYVMDVRLPPPPQRLTGTAIVPDRFVPEASMVPQDVATWAATPAFLALSDKGARIDALADRLIGEGTYSDGDQSQGQLPTRAGHSAYRLTEFVAGPAVVGNAEQYASSLALMVRADRLPSRVVMGFEPPDGRAAVVEIRGEDAEVWVEVPVAGIGWVPVLATPDRSDTTLKKKSPSPPEPDYQTQVPPPPPVLDPEFDEPARSRTDADDTRGPDPDPIDDPPAEDPGVATWMLIAGTAVGIPLLVAALLIGSIALAKTMRRRRRRRRGRPYQRIANAWRELADVGIDMGRPVPATVTRREAALFVGHATVPLARRADAAVFGPGEPTEIDVAQYWADMEDMVDAMHSELGTVGRIKALISISSFHGRRKRRADETKRDSS